MDPIFISHVAEDSALALRIAQGLENAGLPTWTYERDSLPGPSYLHQILRALDRSAAVVVLLSPAALGSWQVDREIVQAHECGRPFVPLLYGLTYEQLRAQRPEWSMAFGAAVAVMVPEDDVDGVLPRIIAGVRWLTAEAGAETAAAAAETAPLAAVAARTPVQGSPAAHVPVVLSARPTPFIGRARGRRARQRTLRAAIDWSYSLLDHGDKTGTLLSPTSA